MSTNPSSNQSVLSFDGKGDYVEVPNCPNPTESMTISCWVKSNTPTWNTYGCLVSKRDAFIIHPFEGSKEVRFYIFSGDWKSANIGPNIDITQWHHYAGTFDGKSVRFYIDGEEVARSDYSGTIALDKGSMFIGWDDGLGGRYFNGQITEVCLWNYARREQQIKGDMHQRLKGDEAGLVGYWALNEGSGSIATDKTSSSKNGQINGATWEQSSIPLSATAPSGNANAQKIEECRKIIEELRTYQQRSWAIGLNGDTLEPDGFLTFFASRQLPFKFFVRSGVSLGDQSAYDQNIATLENYIQTLQSQTTSVGAGGKKPNIVIFITDQESAAVAERWPQSFEDENLPAMKRLKKNGITFNKMFTVTAACSPSRASMITSTYPSEHHIINTVSEPFSIISRYDEYGTAYAQHFLSPTQVNLAHVLKAAGYKVYWKGKWHLSHPKNGTDQWTQGDIEYMKQTYGFDGWHPLDAGVARENVAKFAKGSFYNDERYLRGVKGVKRVIEQDAAQGLYAFSGLSPEEKEAKKQEVFEEIGAKLPKDPDSDSETTYQPEQGILQFIRQYKPEDGPFCLVVSLVNPHDIHVAPSFAKNAGYSLEDFKDFNLPIPETIDEDLSFKPEVQEVFKQGCQVKENQRMQRLKNRGEKVWYVDEIQKGQAPLSNKKVQQMYVNFYGYLKKLVDHQINEVLDALEAKGLIDNTLLVRTSDHGEMCLAHDKLREKAFNAYEETMRVPLIISHPTLFPNAVSSDTFVCSLDLVPTIAKFVGVYDAFKFAFQGCDLTPLFTNPQEVARDREGEVRDTIHFTFDDGVIPDRFKMTPRRIRTIRTDKWKYSVYFNDDGTNYEYEMYDLVNDPLETTNLAGREDYRKTFKELHLKLEEMMVKLKTVPEPFSIYTDEMRQNGFLPPLYWPTPDEAEYEALMDYAANQAQANYRVYRKSMIKAQAQDVDPDMWWVGT